MTTTQTRDLLDRMFVNREPSIRQFEALRPADQPVRILCVKAEKGMGKTWLLKWLHRKHMAPARLSALVDLTSSDAEKPRKLLERIARDLGSPIKEAVLGGDIRAAGGQINIQAEGDVSIEGDVVAGNKVTVNSYGNTDHLTVEVLDPHGEQNLVDQLTGRLFAGLRNLPPPLTAVLFLDHYEAAIKETRGWLEEQLFPALQCYEIPNLIVVVASENPIALFETFEWSEVVLPHPLTGMDEMAVKDYWRRRGIPEDGMPYMLTFLFSDGDPSPDRMCEILTKYLVGLRNRARGDNAAG